MAKRKILVTGASGFIGTHLTDSLLSSGDDIINIDKCEPQKSDYFSLWRNCNILDLDKMKSIFADFQPTHVVHLAAQTGTEGKTLDHYRTNTVGTAQVLESINCTPSVERVIITSSQHVRKPGSGLPTNDEDFVPHGLYGESKAITEKLTRQADLSCVWTIIRPTNIWGPYNNALAQGLWKYMGRGWYIHPQNDPVIRSYGYVKNIVWVINKILNAPPDAVNRRVFYLGDELINQAEWIDAFSIALIGRKTTKIPRELIYLLAKIGDVFEKFGVSFPMNSPRYFNLTTTNPVPINIMEKQFGTPPFSLETGISDTVAWLKNTPAK